MPPTGAAAATADAIVVGGGHNGLTAAFYLARAGLRTLVLERREIVGGACVTEEIAPGCRASTTSYIASMLRPEVIRDLDLTRHGLRMVPCEPGLQVAFEDGSVLPWWSDHDRAVGEFAASISAEDAAAFDRVHRRLQALARYLQPFSLEEPPDLYARGWAKLREGGRAWRRFREIPDRLWVDCVTASNVDDTLAPPGVHVMTAFVQYVPYTLRRGTWDERRDELVRRVAETIEPYAPGFTGSIEAVHALTPLDLERTYSLTEGNIFHGDLQIGQLFSMRPVPAWSRYRTPVRGLYLCGAGAHPGGGVTGAPGYGASHAALRDLRRRRVA